MVGMLPGFCACRGWADLCLFMFTIGSRLVPAVIWWDSRCLLTTHCVELAVTAESTAFCYLDAMDALLSCEALAHMAVALVQSRISCMLGCCSELRPAVTLSQCCSGLQWLAARQGLSAFLTSAAGRPSVLLMAVPQLAWRLAWPYMR